MIRVLNLKTNPVGIVTPGHAFKQHIGIADFRQMRGGDFLRDAPEVWQRIAAQMPPGNWRPYRTAAGELVGVEVAE
ncbi:hypothetical protein ACU6VJ_05140 [Sphaerotilus sulfidivorans]